ncbi:MAG: prolipoprotein diacylglyceryl transferase [Deltaproteobacteria bacterium]|nr:prolipoprotein diacylglyceryl transferase [Deltaproteobacteria bacterium]
MTELVTWWQHLPGSLSPVLLDLGPLKLRYYGLMYVVAFAVVYALVLFRIKTEEKIVISKNQAADLMTAMILGLIIGARLGYVLFYNLSYYLNHPLEIVLPFDFSNGFRFVGIAGMSYHGGLIGVIAAALIYCRRNKVDFWKAADLFVPAVPLGYTFGRLGNFINGELYGRITSYGIGMYFPQAPGKSLRHPTQLYEAFFEGIFLFCILWLTRKMPKPAGASIAIYIMGYGIVRFFIEFYREPDAQIGFVFLSFTMGQLLCFCMVACGAALLYLRART